MSDFAQFIDYTVQTLNAQIAEANAVADAVNSADNPAAVVAEVLKTSDAPEIVAYRDWLDKANSAILAKMSEAEAFAKANLIPAGDVDVEAETAKFKAQDATIKALINALSQVTGGETALPNLAERKTVKGVSKSGSGARAGQGEGTKRPRISKIVVDGTDVFETVGDRTVANLTTLHKWLTARYKSTDVAIPSVKDMQVHLFGAAGTEDLGTLNGKPVEFALSVGSDNLMVTVTPTVK